MSLPTNEKNRTEELLQRFFDRDLSVEEGEELLASWDAHPDWEREARMNYMVEFPLVFFSEVERRPLSIRPTMPFGALFPETMEFDTLRSPDGPSATDRSFDAQERPESLPAAAEIRGVQVLPRQGQGTSFRSFLPLKYVLPVIVLLWIAAMYWEFRPATPLMPTEPAFHALGRIASTAEAVSGLPLSPLRANRRIAKEPITLLDGSVEMFLNNNVRLVLEGPGEFQLISGMNVFCSRGRLSVFVPPEATGFEVTTPSMSARDLGTEFVVDVSENRSELHVVRGRVEARGQSKEPLTFTDGLGVRVDDSGKFVRLPADATRFVTTEEMRRRAAVSLEREVERERTVVERLGRDPSVVFRLDFDDDRSGDDVSGCRRIPGRNPGSTALLFETRRNVVHYSGAVETDSLTLLATVRVDGLARTTQTLFTCRDFGEGAVQWQLGRGGLLQILIGREEKRPALNFSSGPIVSPGLYGTWIQLAVVLDGENGIIAHYLDGEPVGRHTLESPLRFRLSDMEIGNWTQKERVPTLRCFDGAIDEIILFNRSLSEKEIRDLRGLY